MPSPDKSGRLERLRAALPWNRLGALSATLTFGFSQIFFEIILENPSHFPRDAGFHLWVLFWVFLLPFLALFSTETMMVRRWGRDRTFRAWRAGLYSLLMMSFFRQLQAHYSVTLDRSLGLELFLPATLLLGTIVLVVSLKSRKLVHDYAGYLGVLALVLIGAYVVRSGLMGSAWIGDGGDRPAAARPVDAPPVWIILCDELSYEAVAPGGSIDEEAFPHLAALAKESAWFVDATTNHLWTNPSVPTILTGHRSPPEGTPTLFQRLPEGWDGLIIDLWMPTVRWLRTYGGGKDRLHFRGMHDVLGRRPLEMVRYLFSILAESSFVRLPTGAAHRQGISLYTYLDEEIDLLYRSVDPVTARGRVTYWHCPLPHSPFIFSAEGERREDPRSFHEGMSESEADQAWAAYREQASWIDVILGGFVSRLKERGLYDDAILLIISDHGLRSKGAFEPEGFPAVRGDLGPRIPILLRAPGVKPGLVDADYQHIDLVPTLMDVMDWPFDPSDFEGRSVFVDQPSRREKSFTDKERTYVLDPESGLWRLR